METKTIYPLKRKPYVSPLSEIQVKQIIDRFKLGGNNSIIAIATELGISCYHTDKVINNYLKNIQNANNR